MHPRRVSRHAFTLAELLTVIAIIAILAGLLLPAIGMVRRQAAKAKCDATIRSMGAAVDQFRTLNGSYPVSFVKPAVGVPTRAVYDEQVAAASAKLTALAPDLGSTATDAATFLGGIGEGKDLYHVVFLAPPDNPSATTDPRSAPNAATAISGTKQALALNAILVQQLWSIDSGFAPRGVALDPWMQPIRYRPNRYYPFTTNAVPRIDGNEPPQADGYQIWSTGYDQVVGQTNGVDDPGEGGDDQCNWPKLPR